jgi:hypothetical protein
MFFNLIISSVSIKDIYLREYIKLQSIAANVGGIIKFFLIIATLVVNF